ncbi:exportin-T [Arachis stenosperma]|uniref:exportin-T n=1 Tax=Arachis stenosperma TaxID=217475 RepID=UPI0025AC543D|nr:exportin-T [Arachis stenosperma]XP_057736308.1 exportin-T [Arachis stenosperma]
MDDLDKAILINFDESGTIDDSLKKQAKTFCEQIKAKPSICSMCIEKLCFSNLIQVQFWCLQTLHEAIVSRYSSMNPQEKQLIRHSVFSIVCLEGVGANNSATRVLEGPPFVKNKLAQVLVTLIYFEYPLIWSSVFLDFFPHLNKGKMVIDMFCRVLNALDDELISLDYPRTPEDISVATRVKDAMREQCVGQIVRAWYEIVSMYRNVDEEVCVGVLESMRRFISWIDIGLVVNDAFGALLFDLVLAAGVGDRLRSAAIKCLTAVVSKRIEPRSKLALLQSLQISRLFRLVVDDANAELVSDIAVLLTGYATELLDCFKRIDSEGRGISMELLDEVLPSVFHLMKDSELDATFNVVQFLSSYVATMKSITPLGEKQLLHVGKILELISVLIRYDPEYRSNIDMLDKIGKEEEDRMVDFRKDLFVLLRSVGRVAPGVTHLFIRNLLANVISTSSNSSNVEEVEAALSLLYAFGESLTDEAIRDGQGLLSEVVPMLLSTKFSCHPNRLVALMYLETVTRYVKFIQDNTQYIPMVLAAFLDDRGIHHPNINVSRRASYLFLRFVKLLRVKLVPFIETILQSLQDAVAQFTSMNYTTELSRSEDGSHIFEAIGLLIGMEDVPPEKQCDYLSSLLIPLCQQVEVLLVNDKTNVEANVKVAAIQHIIMAINSLSKGFNERLATSSRPTIGLMFKQTLDVLLQVLVVFPKVGSLRSKVISFIHRMVDTLGSSVFPYLPKALGQLLAESEPKEMVGFLLLLNQLMCKFNTSVHDILEESFPAVAGRVLSVIAGDALLLGPGAVTAITEEVRELQELQQTFLSFLHVVATHNLSSVFLSPQSREYLDQIMQLLLYSSCNHKDILVRKACVQIFIRLIKDWCGQPYEEKVPGFRNFMIQTFAINCCLYSVLDRSFEFHDANTHILFGEIVLAQKVMFDKFGNEFLVHFVSKGFSSAHCPPHLAEQYGQKLQEADIKELKSFYKSLIENLRIQQNGSLVFR